MIDNPCRAACSALAGALLLASSAESRPGGSIAGGSEGPQAGKQPKISARCLAPGSNRPVACATSQAGSVLELQASGGLAEAPAVLLIREVGRGGRQVRLQPKWFLDQAMAVKARVPHSPQLCPARAKGQRLQFEIQMLTSDLQNAQHADSVGYFQMRCD